MRTQHHARNTDSLGRYYTSAAISSLLVEQVPALTPKSILDLGSGSGSLSLAASGRWSKSGLITVDVDPRAVDLSERLRNKGFKGHHAHYRHDALAPELSEVLHANGVFAPEVAICNPPFIMKDWRDSYSAILEDAGFSGCLPVIASTDAAVLFLAQNLRLMSSGGSLGIIVPDSLVNAEKYFKFRCELVKRYGVLRAIRLPRGSFGGTDALAHILIVNKGSGGSGFIPLAKFLGNGQVTPDVLVGAEQAVRRLDHDFHVIRSKINPDDKRLYHVTKDVCRGAYNSAQARVADGYVLHTTHIGYEMYGQWLDFSGRNFQPPVGTSQKQLAVEGDILVARVGKTAPDKVIGISRGSVAYSDCLFRIRVPAEWQKIVLSSLASPAGRAWLDQNGYGVAARHITRSDILSLPLVDK